MAATVTDLYKLRGYELGRLRYVLRVLQRDGLLPVSGKGGGSAAMPITAEHCAWFVLGLAGVATSGARETAQAVRRFAGLKHTTDDGRVSRLIDDITKVIQAGDSLVLGAETVRLVRMLFIADPHAPSVELDFYTKGNNESPFVEHRRSYSDAKLSDFFTETPLETPAVVVSGMLIFDLARLIGAPFDASNPVEAPAV